jgi:RNA methyltransferase, TrmH family
MSSPQVERIASASNATLKALKRLAQMPDAYRDQGRVWLEGDHLLQAALARGVALQLAVVTEDAFFARSDWQQLALRATRVLVVSQNA